MKWVWLLALGCSGPTQVTALPPKARACVALPAARAHEVVGRVSDQDGNPLAGVRVDEARWTKSDGQWKRFRGGTTTTAADGTYRLDLMPGEALIVFERERRQVVWGHVSPPGRIDVELDSNASPGVIAMFDARLNAGDPCAPWQCPIDREPGAGWWTQPNPCPDGGTLHFELAPDVAMRGGAGVRCELAGQPHGPVTNWVMVERWWVEEWGWFEHGKRCGAWHEAQVPDPPPTIDQHQER